MGTYCSQGETNSTCATQQAVGSNCTKDEQCGNTLGCNNGVCTIYFSLADGVLATNPASNKWSVCMSGEVDEETNLCRSRTNSNATDVPCDDDCSYTDKETGKVVKEPESCKCAMNASGNRYCVLGNGIFLP
jgi:hypothetical protein